MDMCRCYIMRYKKTRLLICVKVAVKVTRFMFMAKRNMSLIGNNVEISRLCTQEVN